MTRFCAAIDAGADELKANRLGSEDRDSVQPRPKVFRDANREAVEALRRYANRWVPREARPRLQITDTRGRRPSSNDAKRKHGGRDQGGCDSSDDCRIVGPSTMVRQRSRMSSEPADFSGAATVKRGLWMQPDSYGEARSCAG
jgi:hypothetical protein